MLVERTLKLTNLAMLLAFAVVVHTIEAYIPVPIPIPGAKAGLANIITLLTLLLYGFRSGLIIAVGRTVLGSFITGGFLGFGFWMSLSAGIISCTVMSVAILVYRQGYISVISVSILGAVFHNLAQLAMASIIIQNFTLFQGYFPVLVLMAIPIGYFTGLAAQYLETITRNSLKIIGVKGGVRI